MCVKLIATLTIFMIYLFFPPPLHTPQCPQTILDYMEKVEAHGHAQEVLLRQQTEAAAAAAAASLVGGGDGEDSMASWAAASVGGMASGTGASVLSLGSLVATTTTAAR